MSPYLTDAPERSEIEALPGPVLLEFGTNWCGFCRALAPRVERLLAAHPEVRHIKVEDGPGRPLGRSFRVRLWPNLVFLRDGVVVQQSARPEEDEVEQGLSRITGAV